MLCGKGTNAHNRGFAAVFFVLQPCVQESCRVKGAFADISERRGVGQGGLQTGDGGVGAAE